MRGAGLTLRITAACAVLLLAGLGLLVLLGAVSTEAALATGAKALFALLILAVAGLTLTFLYTRNG